LEASGGALPEAMPIEPLPASPAPASDPPSGIRLRATEDHDERPTVASFLEARTARPDKLSREMNLSMDDAREVHQAAARDFVKNVGKIHPAAWWSWWARTVHNRRCDLAREQKRARTKNAQAEHQLPLTLQRQLSPEEEQIRRESVSVVGWLLDQVKPSRREIAQRIVFGGDEPYAPLAEELGLPIGTIKSRWLRAVEDMRKAVFRQPKEERDRLRRALWALVALLFAAVWIRRAVSSTSGRIAALARRARSCVAPILACSAAALVVTVHDGLPQPASADTETFFAGWSNVLAGSVGPLAQDEPPAAPPPPASLPQAAALATTSTPPLPRAAPSTAAALRTAAVAPPAPRAARPLGSPEAVAMARGLLARATAAHHQRDVAAAREALRLYDLRFPENPLPDDRAEVARALLSRGSP